MEKKKINLGVFISGDGTNFQAMINNIEAGTLDAKICFMFTNNPGAGGIKIAANHKIDTIILESKGFLKDRTDLEKAFEPHFDEFLKLYSPQIKTDFQNAIHNIDKNIRDFIYDKVVLSAIEKYNPDLIALAGYMQILTPVIVSKYEGEIMNIHPSILPAFKGSVKGYEAAYNRGVKVHGATVHFVTNDVDGGPIILQKSYERKDDDTFDKFKERGMQVEYEIYSKAIQLFSEGRLKIEGKYVKIL